MTLKAPLTAIYPGTFDPMTVGHEDLIRRASSVFDRLILALALAVAVGHHKRTMFTIAEPLEIAQEIAAPYGNVEVTAFRGLLRDFVVQVGGKGVVRGLRAVSDFEYEFGCRPGHRLGRRPVARRCKYPDAPQPRQFKRPGDQGRWGRLRPSVRGTDGSGLEIRGNPQAAPKKDDFERRSQCSTVLRHFQRPLTRREGRVRGAKGTEEGLLKNLSTIRMFQPTSPTSCRWHSNAQLRQASVKVLINTASQGDGDPRSRSFALDRSNFGVKNLAQRVW